MTETFYTTILLLFKSSEVVRPLVSFNFYTIFTCRGLDCVSLRDPSVGLAPSLAQEARLNC